MIHFEGVLQPKHIRALGVIRHSEEGQLLIDALELVDTNLRDTLCKAPDEILVRRLQGAAMFNQLLIEAIQSLQDDDRNSKKKPTNSF